MAEQVLVGIYKITNPKGRVYIGQSCDILRRFKRYSKYNCIGQTILHRSLLKYGFEKHKREILKLCKRSDLNKYERFYQDKYNVLSENGMNLKLTKTNDRKCYLSKETREKISKSLTGKKLSKEHVDKIIKGTTGMKRTKEQRKKISDSHKKESYINKYRGTKRIGVKGNEGELSVNHKLILNTETGIYYFGTKEASISLNKKQTTVKAWLSGQNKNNSNLKYV